MTIMRHEPAKMALSPLPVGSLLLGMHPTLENSLFPQSDSLRENKIWLSTGDCFWVKERGLCLFPLAVGPHLVQTRMLVSVELMSALVMLI